MDAPISPIRVVIQQPVLPSYRIGIFRALAQRPGLSVTVVHGDNPDLPNVPADGFRAIHVPTVKRKVFGRTIEWAAAQLDYAHSHRTDVLVLSWNMNVASLIPALLKARRNGVATVLWGHGYGKHDTWWRSLPRREVTRLADAVLLYNNITARKFIANGLPREKIFVALNTLDTTKINTSRDRWLNFPQRLEAFAIERGVLGKPAILFVSRLTNKTRLHMLIEAAALVKQQVPDLRVIVIGDGDTAPFRARAAQLGVLENFIFVPGVYDEERLAPWFLLSRAFCYPGQIGLATIHAMAFGLPVVTGDDLANQNPCIEALIPGVNGLLFRDNDANDLAEKLHTLLSDKPLYEKMSAAARRTVREKFTLSGMIDGYESAIRYAFSRRRAGDASLELAQFA